MTPDQEHIRNSLWFELSAMFWRRLGFALVPIPGEGPQVLRGGKWVPVGTPPESPAPSPPAPPSERGVGACGVPGCNCRTVSLGEQLASEGIAQTDRDALTIDGMPVVHLRLSKRMIIGGTRRDSGGDMRTFAVPGIKREDLLRVETYGNPATPDMVWLTVLALAPPGANATSTLAPSHDGKVVVSASTLVPRELSRVAVSINEDHGEIDITIFDALDVTEQVFLPGKPPPPMS